MDGPRAGIMHTIVCMASLTLLIRTRLIHSVATASQRGIVRAESPHGINCTSYNSPGSWTAVAQGYMEYKQKGIVKGGFGAGVQRTWMRCWYGDALCLNGPSCASLLSFPGSSSERKASMYSRRKT